MTTSGFTSLAWSDLEFNYKSWAVKFTYIKYSPEPGPRSFTDAGLGSGNAVLYVQELTSTTAKLVRYQTYNGISVTIDLIKESISGVNRAVVETVTIVDSVNGQTLVLEMSRNASNQPIYTIDGYSPNPVLCLLMSLDWHRAAFLKDQDLTISISATGSVSASIATPGCSAYSNLYNPGSLSYPGDTTTVYTTGFADRLRSERHSTGTIYYDGMNLGPNASNGLDISPTFSYFYWQIRWDKTDPDNPNCYAWLGRDGQVSKSYNPATQSMDRYWFEPLTLSNSGSGSDVWANWTHSFSASMS